MRSNIELQKDERFLNDFESVAKEEFKSNLTATKLINYEEKIPEITQKEIDLIKQKKYANMEKMESEKMSWIKSVQSNEQNIKLYHRFDFSGNLLSLDESQNLSCKLGMHHHGEEPHLAGYSLQELFDLTRSNFPQQRVFAFSTLSKIIQKDRRGEHNLSEEKDASSVQSLLNAGFIFVLRLALDEKAGGLVKTAVDCLHSLICALPSERRLEEESFLLIADDRNACVGESLHVRELVNDDDDDVWKSNVTDHQAASRDLFVGLIKMDVVKRLRYLLEEMCDLDVQTTLKCINIIERLCQHSLKASMHVYEHPHLIPYLLSKTRSCVAEMIGSSVDVDKKVECARVMRAIVDVWRRISQAGRHLCARLLARIDQPTSDFMWSVALDGNDHDLRHNGELRTATLKFLMSVSLYGHLDAELRSRRSEMMTKFEQLVPRSSSHHIFIRFFLSCASRPKVWIDSGRSVEFSCALACSLLDNEDDREELHQLGPMVMNFLAHQLHRADGATPEDESSFVSRLKSEQFLPSHVFPLALKLAQTCDFTSDVTPPVSPHISSLHSLLRHTSTSDASSLNRHRIALLAALLRFSSLALRWNSEGVAGFFNELLSCVKWEEVQLVGHHHPIAYIATSQLLINLLDLAAKLKMKKMDKGGVGLWDCSTLHYVALNLSVGLRQGDEEKLRQVLAHLFSPLFMSEPGEKTLACDHLHTIRSIYLRLLIGNSGSVESKEVKRLMNTSESRSTLLPLDWPFIPILHQYDLTIDASQRPKDEKDQKGWMCEDPSSSIQSALNLICYLEEARSLYMKKISTVSKVVRLMCVFLSGDELFRSDKIRVPLSRLFARYCRHPSHLDFLAPIPGVRSFYDLYESLLDQYEAVSMCDALFSSVCFLPLANYPHTGADNKKLKLCFWRAHHSSLRMHLIAPHQLLLPLDEAYVGGKREEDVEVLKAYSDAIRSGAVRKQRSPCLYAIATAHLSANSPETPEVKVVAQNFS